MTDFFQVGGSLPSDSRSYIPRAADEVIVYRLKRGETCFVFDSRQMGKSSLLVRARKTLVEAGIRCCYIDFSRVASVDVTPSSWFASLAAELWRGFGLEREIDFPSSWRRLSTASPESRFWHFLEGEIVPALAGSQVAIFIDETDSVLGLPFVPEAFFCWIRNRSVRKSASERIGFALFGVLSPVDFGAGIGCCQMDHAHTLALGPLQGPAVKALARGLDKLDGPSGEILDAILCWTGGQPFLTQRLCRLAQRQESFPAGRTPRKWVDELVQTHVMEGWETSDEPIHLRTIHERLLANPERSRRRLLLLSEIHESRRLEPDGSLEQRELLLSGVATIKDGSLAFRNCLYAAVFNQDWVFDKLRSCPL